MVFVYIYIYIYEDLDIYEDKDVVFVYKGTLVFLQSLSHFPLLGTLWTLPSPACSVYGIFQARISQWLAIFFSKGSSLPRFGALISSLRGRFFPTEPPKKTYGMFFSHTRNEINAICSNMKHIILSKIRKTNSVWYHLQNLKTLQNGGYNENRVSQVYRTVTISWRMGVGEGKLQRWWSVRHKLRCKLSSRM